ncbi:MAG: hypothetical protein J6U06_05480 [Spirochaetaceae bacterium]|nr:hypothetical protein [Spirochaetaceae bacterium]
MKKFFLYFSILLVFLFSSCALSKEAHIKDEYVTTESGGLISKALKFEGEYKDEKYIFLRLYNVYYDEDFQIGNLLKAAIAVLGRHLTVSITPTLQFHTNFQMTLSA